MAPKRIFLTVVGSLREPDFEKAKACAKYLESTVEDFYVTITGLMPTDYEAYRATEGKKLGGKAALTKKQVFVFYTVGQAKQYLGSTDGLLAWAKANYDYEDTTNPAIYNQLAIIAWKNLLGDPSKRFVYFDFTVEGRHLGQIVVELFHDLCPSLCDNFIKLCTGWKGGKYHYKNTKIHRVVPGGWIQGGDIDGSLGNGGDSVEECPLPDESYAIPHDQPGLLGMASTSKHQNLSQFYITTKEQPYFDGRKVVIGRVVHGMRIVHVIEKTITFTERPIDDVLISDCGVPVIPGSRVREKVKARPLPDSEEEAAARIQAVYRGRNARKAMTNFMDSEINEEGHAYIWGDDVFGQLGHEKLRKVYKAPTVLKKFTDRAIVKLACGSMHTALLLACGELWTWGNGHHGQLGHGSFESFPFPKLVEGDFTNIQTIACGAMHTGIVCNDGKDVYTWGSNDYGELGLGTTEHYDLVQTSPRQVDFGEELVSWIGMGNGYSAALTTGGKLYTWGNGARGRLGHGEFHDGYLETTPRLVETLANKEIVEVAINIGADHMVAIEKQGKAFVWGLGNDGQLGLGEVDDENTLLERDAKGNYISKYPNSFLVDRLTRAEQEALEQPEEDEFGLKSNEAEPEDKNKKVYKIVHACVGSNFTAIMTELDPECVEKNEAEEQEAAAQEQPPPAEGQPASSPVEGEEEEVPVEKEDFGLRDDIDEEDIEGQNTYSYAFTCGAGNSGALGYVDAVEEVPAETPRTHATGSTAQPTPRSNAEPTETPRTIETEPAIVLRPPEKQVVPRMVTKFPVHRKTVMMDAGKNFVAVLCSNSDVITWGANDYHQLGREPPIVKEPIDEDDEPIVIEPDCVHPGIIKDLRRHDLNSISCGSTYIAAVSTSSVEKFIPVPEIDPIEALDLPKMRKDYISKLFALMDNDGSGFISVDELYPLAKKLQPGVTRDKVVEGLSYMDDSGDNRVQLFEFMEWFAAFTASTNDEEFQSGCEYLLEHMYDPDATEDDEEGDGDGDGEDAADEGAED